MSALQWGTVSDWVSGISTAIAVIVALVFSLRADRREIEAKTTAVFAWLTVDDSRRGRLYVSNLTEIPIYRWSAVARWPSPSGEMISMSTGSAQFGLLPPGKHVFDVRARPDLPANDSTITVEFAFADTYGRVMVRAPTGRLRRQRGSAEVLDEQR